jgi:hypothetical protein
MEDSNPKTIIGKNLIYLLKIIKNGESIDNLFRDYCKDNGECGYLFEKIGDILVKCGYIFPNNEYNHMNGNINLGKMKIINNLEAYLKSSKINGNSRGSSDITLQNKQNKSWIFISSKYFIDDSKKSIKEYEVQDILKEIKEHNEIYKESKIYLFVNDKKKVKKIISNSKKTNNTISINIDDIFGLNKIKKYYLVLQKDLQSIDLEKNGSINNVFCISKDKLVLRFHQDLITLKTLNYISEGEKVILWGWKCRAGKTFGVGGLLIKYKKKFNICNSLIITPAPNETKSQFVDEMFNKYREFNDFNIIEIKDGKHLQNLGIKQNNIIITSKQLLDDYCNDNKIQSIINLNLDMIIFDEAHFGGCSRLSKEIINTYSSQNTIKLLLTATFHKPILEWNIPSHCQLYWNMEDEQFCKKRNINKLIEKHGNITKTFINEDNMEDLLNCYDKMPDLELITTIMDQHRYDLIISQIKGTKSGFSLTELFSLNKNGQFKYPKEVEIFLSYISGSLRGAIRDKKSIFERIKTISSNKNSRTTLCNENFTTQLWFLTYGQGMPIDIVSKCLKSKINNDSILKDYEVMIINSKKEYNLKDLKGDINKTENKAKSDGKLGLILLAGNQCSLGITLPLCDVVILLNNTLSADRILQMMYRCMSESPNGSKKCGFVVDFNISRVINTLLEYNIHQKNKTIENKLEYIIENNLINIDSDLFKGVEKKNEYGVKLVTKILDIWKSDPINSFKYLLKRIENSVLELESDDQNILNKYFTSSGKSSMTVKFKMDEDNNQDLPNGKSKLIKDNTNNDKDNKDDEEDEKEEIIQISLTKDILPYVIKLSFILSMNDKEMDFVKILENIKKNPNLLDVFNEQCTIWWNRQDIIDFLIKIVNKYIKKNSDPYNIAIQFKMSLQSLIDSPKELLELIDDCLKPKDIEKKKYGEVFTPMSFINDSMLADLEAYYTKQYNKNIFEDETLKWGDTTSGMGNFPIAIYYKLMEGLKKKIPDEQDRKKHILEKMLFMAEYNKKNCFVIKQIFNMNNEFKLNLYEGDSLQLDIQKEFGIDKFDIVIGNPPYNEELKSTGAKALYNKFVEYYIEKCNLLCFVIPSRWFSGGKGLNSFRKNMLERTDIVYINHFDDASKIFDNSVDIKGGVNYFLKDTNHKGDCKYNGSITKLNNYDVFVDGKFHALIDKLIKFELLPKLYLGRYFGVESNDKRLKSDKTKDTIKCYVSKQKGFKKNIEKKEIKKEYNFWKLITTEAAHGHKSAFGNSFVGTPDEIHTGSYISFKVSNEAEGKSLLGYMKCRLPNFMLSLRKNSQHINEDVCKWIPLPPLNKEWTDEEVYKHFKLSEDDIKLINETNIVGYKNIVKKIEGNAETPAIKPKPVSRKKKQVVVDVLVKQPIEPKRVFKIKSKIGKVDKPIPGESVVMADVKPKKKSKK